MTRVGTYSSPIEAAAPQAMQPHCTLISRGGNLKGSPCLQGCGGWQPDQLGHELLGGGGRALGRKGP